MIINCITIDDEPLALEKLKGYIDKIQYLNLLASFDNGADSLDYLKKNHVDLIFLDIQMDDFTGIQLLEALKIKPKVILTTAYDQYAIKGYELDVTDYLLKPISFDRFIKSVEKVYTILEKESGSTIRLKESEMHTDKKGNFIFVKSDYKLQKVNFKDILYIEGMKDYLRIVTPEKRLMVLQNFRRMEDILPENKFIRVHKSYIISVEKIDSIGKKSLKVGEMNIPIGESYKKAFFDFLEEHNLL
ncbi:MAG: LytTR family DNA-binding domain-containing protein [Bacteroidetes bacterium]|nr:LytTR family DNA-binding domain-containing protein [Bacteroidota bacterium]